MGATVGVEDALVEGVVLGIILGSSDGGNDGIVLGATLGAPVDGTDDGSSERANDGVVEGLSDGGGEGYIDWKVFPSSRDDDDDDDANILLLAADKPKNVMAPPITAKIADMISIFQIGDRRLYAMTIDLLLDGIGTGAAVWLLLFSEVSSAVDVVSTFPCASSIGLLFLPSSPHFSWELLGSLRFL